MYELYFKHFNSKVPVTPAEQEIIQSYLTPKKLRKKQYLLQEGDVCKWVAFVEKGALRSYTVNENGSEHIIQFALEGWSISDLFSFLTSEPATYNIEAIEDSELILISNSAHNELLKRMQKYETYIRLQITNAYISLQRRITSVNSLPVETRYQNLTRLYPDIIQRVPQHMIASYMGVTPETLSRARKKISGER
jgi:CRP-like cAMP-binding protein